jgi:hypothetical protein
VRGARHPGLCRLDAPAAQRAPRKRKVAAVAAEGVYAVSRLLDERRLGSARQFLVRWAPPYGPADDSWEDGSNINDARLIRAFEAAQGPSAPPLHHGPPAARGSESEAQQREVDAAEQRWAAMAVGSSHLHTGPQQPSPKAPRTSSTRGTP